MRVEVDLAKCQGYANCIIEAPEVFDLDEDANQAVVLLETVPEALEEDVRRAEASCPVRAIAVRD